MQYLDAMIEFIKFSNRFNKSEDSKPATPSEINILEKELEVHLPNEYKTFLLNVGNIWTPDILDLVVEKELEMFDAQQFWSIDEILEDKRNGWTKRVATEIIPFASDCMGNIFSFLTEDLRQEKESASIYFFDHDFNTVEKIESSFTVWIENFNEI